MFLDVRRQGRHGFTVVELAVGIGIFMLLMAGFAAIYFGSAGKTERATQKADLAEQARNAYFKMTEEIKVGIDLLHPVDGSAPAPYLLFTNDKYELVAYWVEKYTLPERPNEPVRRLMRLNFNDPAGRKAEVLAPFVERVQFARKGARLVDVAMTFRDADRNVMALSSSVDCRNAVTVN